MLRGAPWSTIFRLAKFCLYPLCPPSRSSYILQTVYLSKFLQPPVWLSVSHNSLCQLFQLLLILVQSREINGDSISFIFSFFSVVANYRHFFLIWLKIYSAVLCVKYSPLSSISSSHNLSYTLRIFSFCTCFIPRYIFCLSHCSYHDA